MTRVKGAKSEAVTKYWLKWYATDHCPLCGNWGLIDTRRVKTPAGVQVGDLHFCICPNGQAWRAGNADINKLAEQMK